MRDFGTPPSPESVDADLAHRFSYHAPPDRDTVDAHLAMRDHGLGFARAIVQRAPTCRETSLAITKIEEAVMWANAAIARHGLRDA